MTAVADEEEIADVVAEERVGARMCVSIVVDAGAGIDLIEEAEGIVDETPLTI